jgi:hypothetical protein
MPESEEPATNDGRSIKPLLAVFCITVVIFLLLVSFIFTQHLIPNSNQIFVYVFFPGVVLLTTLGIILIMMAVRAQIRKGLKYSFVLTGVSAVGMPASAILHNMAYALMIYFFGEDFWSGQDGGDEAVFFILALFVFPALLIASAISGAIILARSKGNFWR